MPEWIVQKAIKRTDPVPDGGFTSVKIQDLGQKARVDWVSAKPKAVASKVLHNFQLTDKVGSSSIAVRIASGFSRYAVGGTTGSEGFFKPNINTSLGLEVDSKVQLSYTHFSGAVINIITVIGWSKWM